MSGIRFSTDIVIILHKSNKLKQMIMKKYFLTMAVMALFAIGFAASDEEESSSSGSSSSETQTEQKQETEAERQAREQKEEAERKEKRIKDVKELADYWGNQDPFSHRSDAEKQCKDIYITRLGTPSTEEDFEMFQIWKEIYMAKWEEKQKAKRKMDNF